MTIQSRRVMCDEHTEEDACIALSEPRIERP
jgi:hypothetical protein